MKKTEPETTITCVLGVGDAALGLTGGGTVTAVGQLVEVRECSGRGAFGRRGDRRSAKELRKLLRVNRGQCYGHQGREAIRVSAGHTFYMVGASIDGPELPEDWGYKHIVFIVELEREVEDHSPGVVVVLSEVGKVPKGLKLSRNGMEGGSGGVVFNAEDSQLGRFSYRWSRVELTVHSGCKRTATDQELVPEVKVVNPPR